MSVSKLGLSLPAATALLLLSTACGLTNPFQKAAPRPDAGPSSLHAPLAVTLESASPTTETSVQLTVLWCGQITAVFVNEGEAPTTADTGWVPCVTDVGGLVHELAPGGGAHLLHVWGRDADGRVSNEPTQVTVVVGNGMFALGDAHSCVLIAGAVKCWGDNTWGQLGDGATVGSATPVIPAGLESGVEAIVSGQHSSATCALRGGQVWCWGLNSFGQLGSRAPTTQCTDGTAMKTCSRSPVLVTDGVATPLAGVVSLQGGGDFFCAHLSDDSVRCWGSNASGQLGDNQASGMSTATPVSPGLTQDTSWLSSGYATSCALLKDGSAVSCWGLDYGKYDNGYGPTSALVGGTGSVTVGALQIGKTPRHNVALDGADLPDSMVIGYYHACGLFQGDVKCWGLNRNGQLGNGLRTNSPTAITVALSAKADLLVTGTHHACARLVTGTVQCWGMNDFGELGVTSDEVGGDRTVSRVPLATASLGHVAALGAGREQSCAATDAGIVCWGADTHSLLQGAATETCTLPPDDTLAPCSHAPVVMTGL